MVAVGSLHKVWVDLTEEINTLEALISNFRKHFQEDWWEVMSGAEQAFAYHRDWDGYIAIKGLKKCTGLLVGDLTLERVYKIILG